MGFVRAVAAGMVATSVVLAGCGGGGGGGGSSPPPAEAAKPLSLTVKVNGVAGTAADSFNISSSDTVEVSSSAGVTWTSTGEQLRLSQAESSPTQWQARVVKTSGSATTLTLKASAGTEAALNKTLTFQVAAGDPRSGNYRVYSSSGAQFSLALDFDAKSYAFTASNNGDPDASGTFSEDATETGTFVFASNRVTTTANTARFRVADGTVMGAFPFSLMHKSPVVYSTRPFMATRALSYSQASLDGVYNRFGLGLNSADDTSQITQMSISNGGTKVQVCNHLTIYPITLCPTVANYSVVAGSAPGTWQLLDGNGTSAGSFAVSALADAKVYLAAGRANSSSTDALFRIGVTDKSTWQVGLGHGSASTGSWGTVDLKADNTSTRTGIATDGSAVNTANSYFNMVVPDPVTNAAVPGVQGMRQLPGQGGSTYFAMQGAGLFAIVGANDVAHATNGYLQLSLMD